MSRIEDAVQDFLQRAERAWRCGLTPKYLRRWASEEGILDYIQIFADRRRKPEAA